MEEIEVAVGEKERDFKRDLESARAEEMGGTCERRGSEVFCTKLMKATNPRE